MAKEIVQKSHEIGAGRSAGKNTTGTLERRASVKKMLGDTDDMLFVTGLAGAKGDVLEAIGADNPRVYPLGGAMGAAAGMALGLALAQRDIELVQEDGFWMLRLLRRTEASRGQ